MNTLIDDQLRTLKAFITDLANTTYKKDGKGLLLSRVGEIIAKEQRGLRNVLGNRKLVGFIEAELADSVQIITSPENHIVKVILPADVTVNGDVLRFLPKHDATSTTVSKPRYNRAFWAAFSRPLAKDYTRLVGFEPHVHYDDIVGDAPATTIKKIVPHSLVIDEATEPDPAKRALRINEVISEWLKTNAVSADIVKAKTEKDQASAMMYGSHKGSLLEIMLAALDDTDLKRIQMPLDIVAKLHRRH